MNLKRLRNDRFSYQILVHYTIVINVQWTLTHAHMHACMYMYTELFLFTSFTYNYFCDYCQLLSSDTRRLSSRVGSTVILFMD